MSKSSARQRLLARRISNARTERHSGAGSQYDFGAMNRSGPTEWMSAMEQDRAALGMYLRDWQAKKIVNIPVDDMLREGWCLGGMGEDQIAAIERAQDMMGVLESFRQAMRLESLLGGAALYLGVSDGNTNPAVPLDLATLQKGALKFINVIPRSRVSRTDFNTDPMTPGYGRAELFHIQGHRVHKSRLILFTGDPLLSVPDSTIAWTGIDRNDGFGYSRLLAIMDDLTRATGSRQAAYQLVQRAGVFFAQMDTESLDGTEASESQHQALKDIVNQINAYRGAVFSTTPGQTFPPISTISPAFGSVPELMMSFLQVLSAASDIPATRFLGQAPGGLNATGESDLENYYGRLESAQRQILRPQLFQLMQVLVPSTLGPGVVREGDIDVTFEPLWSLSEKEQAEVRKMDADTINVLVTAGILTTEEAAAECGARGILEIELDRSGDRLLAPPIDEGAPPLEESLAALAIANPEPEIVPAIV